MSSFVFFFMFCSHVKIKKGGKKYSCEKYESIRKSRLRSPTGKFLDLCSCFLSSWGLLPIVFIKGGACLFSYSSVLAVAAEGSA